MIGEDRSYRSFFSIFCPSNLHSKFCIEKITKKMRKSSILASQNPPKIHPKCLQNRRPKKHASFHRFLLEFGCMLQKPTSKNVRPRSVLLAFHKFQFIAFGMHFRFKKPTKTLSKTRTEPFKNRCRKCVVFQHRFFQVSASIVEPLGPPTWNQVG